MPNVAPEWSLAVIAAAFVVAVLFLVPALWQVRRTARQAERVLAEINGTLPGLLNDLRDMIQRLGSTAETLQALAAAMDRLGHLAGAVGQAAEHVRDVVVPSVSSVAGVFAVLREGMQWMRPSRNRGRDGS